MNKLIRTNFLSLALAFTLAGCSSTYSRYVEADPGVGVDIHVYFDALSPYGTWFNHDAYGRVWHPHRMRSGWRPYTHGYWAHTHDYGWLWVSNWDWGWAPFHYGRWALDDFYGWIWIPGRVWAPAWVFWRYGAGFTAWTPIPPAVYWRRRHGLVYGHFRMKRDLPWNHWVAVRDRHLPSRDIHRHLFRDRAVSKIMRNTRHDAGPALFGDRIVNHGVPVRQIERETGRRLEPARVRRLEDARARRSDVRHGEIGIVRPRFRRNDAAQARREREPDERAARELQSIRQRQRPDHDRSGWPERPGDRRFQEFDDHDRNIKRPRQDQRLAPLPRQQYQQDRTRRLHSNLSTRPQEHPQPQRFQRPEGNRDQRGYAPPRTPERRYDRDLSSRKEGRGSAHPRRVPGRSWGDGRNIKRSPQVQKFTPVPRQQYRQDRIRRLHSNLSTRTQEHPQLPRFQRPQGNRDQRGYAPPRTSERRYDRDLSSRKEGRGSAHPRRVPGQSWGGRGNARR